MKRSSILILTLMVIQVNIFAGELQEIELMTVKGRVADSSFQYKINTIDQNEITVFKAGSSTEIFKYSNSSSLVYFKILYLLEVNGKKDRYLLTLWASGAHSEQVMIFDLLGKSKPLFQTGSAWGFEFQVKKDHLVIIGRGGMNPVTNIPKPIKSIWRPSK